MSATSSIEWTDRTWNPVRGCSVISPGCANCYAMKQAHRFSGVGKPYEGLTKLTERSGPQWTGQIRTVEAALLEPLSWRKPQRVFVNSMSDLFHEGVPDRFIDQVFGVMALSTQHTFQVLTKRPERMLEYFRVKPSAPLSDCVEARVGRHAEAIATRRGEVTSEPWWDAFWHWPLPNVWLGVSVEDQKHADERIPLLLQTPAAVRFISAEPLLDPVDLTRIDYTEKLRATARDFAKFQGWDPGEVDRDITGPAVIDALRGRFDDGEDSGDYEKKLDWVIVGGESGPGARPFNLAWGRSIVEQCTAAGVPVFVKQLGAVPVTRCQQCDRAVGRVQGGWVDSCGAAHTALIGESLQIRDSKGGAISEWPADLQVREFPRGYMA